MARLLVVRHARSAWNAEGRWQGWADPPLDPDGEAQAVAAGTELAATVDPADVALLVASGLRRSSRTAQLLAESAGLALPITVVPDLREYDVGEWSGLRRVEIAARWPELLAAWDAGEVTTAPGGEDRDVFDARVRSGIRQVDDLVTLAERRAGEVGLVVAHGRVIGSLARAGGWAEEPIRHLSGYCLDVDGDRVTVVERVPLLKAVAPARGDP